MADNRIAYLDILKIAALFFVVCIHLVAGLFVGQPVDSDAWLRANVIDSASRWCVPVFVMVSGALMLRPDKDLSIKRLYSKNIARIAIAFLVWSLFYALISVYRDGFEGWRSLFEMIVLGKYHTKRLYATTGSKVDRSKSDGSHLYHYHLARIAASLGMGAAFSWYHLFESYSEGLS